jgi:hypothetical protein
MSSCPSPFLLVQGGGGVVMFVRIFHKHEYSIKTGFFKRTFLVFPDLNAQISCLCGTEKCIFWWIYGYARPIAPIKLAPGVWKRYDVDDFTPGLFLPVESLLTNVINHRITLEIALRLC